MGFSYKRLKKELPRPRWALASPGRNGFFVLGGRVYYVDDEPKQACVFCASDEDIPFALEQIEKLETENGLALPGDSPTRH